MSAKRTHNVMLRLTPHEHERLMKAVPPGEEVAAFARRTLLSALDGGQSGDVRRAAAFVVAALSSDIGFEEALSLFDEHVSVPVKEA